MKDVAEKWMEDAARELSDYEPIRQRVVDAIARHFAAREREGWHPKTEHPARAGWYDVYRYEDGHRSVRCWDDSIEAWMYVGDHHSLFVPNNSFDVWRPLPLAPFTAAQGEKQP